MRFRLLVLWLVLAGGLLLPGAAAAVTQTAQLGQVSATFSYSVSGGGSGLPTFSHQHLAISRGGKVVYDQDVKGCPGCQPGAYPTSHPSIQVIDLAGTAEPNVVLSLFTGGANCCFIAQIFTYAPAAGSYVEAGHNFLNPGFSLKRLNGRLRLVSADARWLGFLTSDAASGTPLQIWRFAADRFIDVTARYPAMVRSDAALWWRTFKKYIRMGGTGALAAWAADEERLGHDKLVQRTLHEQLRAGHLTGGFVNGRAYITALNRLLHRYGYRR
jgi:hypothetical protein